MMQSTFVLVGLLKAKKENTQNSETVIMFSRFHCNELVIQDNHVTSDFFNFWCQTLAPWPGWTNITACFQEQYKEVGQGLDQLLVLPLKY